MQFINDILASLVELTYWKQKESSQFRESYSPPEWLYEMCTITLVGPRSTGHTYAAAHFAQEHNLKNVMVLTSDALYCVKAIRRLVPGDNPIAVHQLKSGETTWEKHLPNEPLDALIIEGPFRMSREQIDHARNFALSEMVWGRPFLFILLG